MVRPQIVQIQVPNPLNLNSLQQLLGTINWIRPSLVITSGKLTNLFNTLKGDPDLNSPRSLSNQARQELDLVNQYLSSRQLTRVNRQLPVRLFCFLTLGTPTGLIGQLSPNLEMIGWLFLFHQPQSTITTYITVLCQLIIKGRDRVIQLFGHDPAVIHVPLTQVYLQLYSQSLEFQCAVTDFMGDLNIHLPSDKLLQNLPTLNIRMGEKTQRHSYSQS